MAEFAGVGSPDDVRPSDSVSQVGSIVSYTGGGGRMSSASSGSRVVPDTPLPLDPYDGGAVASRPFLPPDLGGQQALVHTASGGGSYCSTFMCCKCKTARPLVDLSTDRKNVCNL
jgi:hypothetical protein